MINRSSSDIAALLETVLTTAGVTDSATREAASRGHGLAPILEDYVAKVQRRSHLVTDGDFATLRANGYSEDDIFEITVAAALGAAHAALQSALAAMEADS
jgi:alkylhydroperoxidase family enzyme